MASRFGVATTVLVGVGLVKGPDTVVRAPSTVAPAAIINEELILLSFGLKMFAVIIAKDNLSNISADYTIPDY